MYCTALAFQLLEALEFGIMRGGMGIMVPERREEIVFFGMKSLIAGTLATCLTGDQAHELNI